MDLITTKKLDFSFRIRQEFLERCKRNPKYSLRSFAIFLGVPVSTLSKIINSKIPLTEKMIIRIGISLSLKLEEIEFYASKNSGKKPSVFFEPINFDIFTVISDWYYFALLELLNINAMNQSPRFLAKKLGLKETIIRISLERLEKVGLIKKVKNRWKIIKKNNTCILKNYTNDALKRLQIQILEKAIESIKQNSIEKRDNTGITMAISKKDIPLAKERIKKFRRQMSQELESAKDLDSVYQLSVSFFPLTTD